jgi:hypothetical protein
MAKSKSDLVFSREDGVSPISAFTLIQQQERMRKLLKLPWDACVHSAGHTALTNLGLTGVDTFTLQRAAGHANVTTTRKYVHATPPTIKDAFQKKVRNERRDRRMTRKRVARMAGIPSNGDHPLHRGIFGNSGLLDVTFRYWRYDRCENEKVLQHREIRGLQGVKVVSAEGIESAWKRTFNKIQSNGRHF